MHCSAGTDWKKTAREYFGVARRLAAEGEDNSEVLPYLRLALKRAGGAEAAHLDPAEVSRIIGNDSRNGAGLLPAEATGVAAGEQQRPAVMAAASEAPRRNRRPWPRLRAFLRLAR